MAKAVTQPRPYWHVDLKWIFGILFLISLQLTILFVNLYVLTNEKNGVDISTHLVATAFSRNGLDDGSDLVAAKKQIAQSPDKRIYPIPKNKEVFITEEDLNTLSPREIRYKTFRKITEPLYKMGLDEYASRFAPDQQSREQFRQSAFLLSVFTAKTHKAIGGWLVLFIGISLVFLAGLVFFSSGFGRFVSPAIVSIMVGLFALPLAVISSASKSGPEPPQWQEAVAPIVGISAGIYLILLISGIVLLVAAGIGHAVTKRKTK